MHRHISHVIFLNTSNPSIYGMKILCETVFSKTLPALRAIIANEMIKNYNLTENEVAKLLGIRQSAVSQYISGSRGKNTEQLSSNKKFMKQIKQLTKRIVEKKTTFYNEICPICKNQRTSIFSKESLHQCLCLIELDRGRK